MRKWGLILGGLAVIGLGVLAGRLGFTPFRDETTPREPDDGLELTAQIFMGGGLPKRLVEDAINGRMGDLRACWHGGSWVERDLTLHLEVSTAGTLTPTVMTNTGDAELARCVKDAASRWTFASSTRPTQINVELSGHRRPPARPRPL